MGILCSAKCLFQVLFFDGKGIREYCKRHIKTNEEIYRIFYYDAPPLDRISQTPFGETRDMGDTATATRMKKLLESIRETPEMALRLGKVAWQNDWQLKEAVLKKTRGDKKCFNLE